MLYHSKIDRIAIGLLASAAAIVPAHVSAQSDGVRAERAAPAEIVIDEDDDYHGTIVVSAAGIDRLDILAGTDVVGGLELQRNLEGQIGDVLDHLPGVSATGFSPGASRPVLRGFQGERVRVLVDGIGSIDASNTSADHAVSIDPLTADRIEVLRGPAVLLYGSQAIGGAVNVIDRRIPRRLPAEPVHVDFTGAIDSAFERREIGGSMDTALTGNLVLHVDGSYRETSDYEIPGFVLSDTLRQDLLAEAAEEEAEEPEEAAELREAAALAGTVPNSGVETYSLGAGLSYLGDGLRLGGSIGYYDTFYGVPTRPGAEHAHEEGEEDGGEEEGEEIVSIGLEQFRADFRGSLDLGGFFSELRVRSGYSDYQHIEFEGDEVGTTFDVTGHETRLELVQAERDGWSGAFGAQYYHRDFDAVGVEAYVAPNLTDQFAVFALQEVDLGGIGIEGALRYERTDVSSDPLGLDLDFDTFSGALGLSSDPDADLRVGVNASRAERAPSAEELFSNGPHIATQQFEIGDAGLTKEGAWGVEAYLAGRFGDAEVSFAVYNLWFDDFIYLAANGDEEDGLPVYQYLQSDADWFGIEGEVRFPVLDAGGVSVNAEFGGDYIHAELDNGQAIPRIPPLSMFIGVDASFGPFTAATQMRFTDAPRDLAPFETPTDSFTMLDASLAWRPLRGSDNLTVLLQGQNLFDAEGRNHASFTKDFVPMAGRNVRLSVRLSL